MQSQRLTFFNCFSIRGVSIILELAPLPTIPLPIPLPKNSLEVEAVIDTGVKMVALPKNLVNELGLEKIEDVRVKYADGRIVRKEVYGVVRLELKGRVGNFDILAENEEISLIGQIVLEGLDLIIEQSRRKLIPNPRSPEMPMIEVFITIGYKGKYPYSDTDMNKG